MSSIIDALKKSDNNRTTESGANINQIKFGNEPPPKNRRGFWLLVILLLLVALGAFAWKQGWHHSATTQIKSWFGTDTSAQSESVEANTDNKQPANNNNQTEIETNLKTESASKLTPPKPDEVKAISLASENNTDEPKAEGEKQQLEVMASREPSSDSKESEEVKTKQEEETLRKEVAKVESDKAARKAKQDKKDLEPAMKQDYLLVHQIDFEIRKNIPPVKLNIHIYDPEPENRIVILNGVKYATGDLIEELVTVEEINKQGVVLQFEGVKFLIPK